jgi:CAAX prenyl protease-like protein
MNLRHPAVPYVLPFAVFVALLSGGSALGLPPRADLAVRLLAPALVMWFFSRGALDFRCRAPWASVAIGVAVFAVWIGPDLLFPAWRQHWLFSNSLTGGLKTTLPEGAATDAISLWLRGLRAALVVPPLEELFWRAWLMRWLINPDFRSVPLGAWQRNAFLITAALFALEHGPYWEVGLAAGLIYNGWMVRVKSLGDLILAHAVTNACLSLFVVLAGRWEYWL